MIVLVACMLVIGWDLVLHFRSTREQPLNHITTDPVNPGNDLEIGAPPPTPVAGVTRQRLGFRSIFSNANASFRSTSTTSSRWSMRNIFENVRFPRQRETSGSSSGDPGTPPPRYESLERLAVITGDESFFRRQAAARAANDEMTISPADPVNASHSESEEAAKDSASEGAVPIDRVPLATEVQPAETSVELQERDEAHCADAEVAAEDGAPSGAADEVSAEDGAPSGAADEVAAEDGAPSDVADEVSAEDGAPSVVADEVSAEDGAPSVVADEVAAEDGAPSVVADEVAAEDGAPSAVADEVAAEDVAPSGAADEVAAEDVAPSGAADEVSAEDGAPSGAADEASAVDGAPSVVADDVAAEDGAPSVVADDVAAEDGAPSVVADDVAAEDGAPSVVADDVAAEEGAPSAVADEVAAEDGAPLVVVGNGQASPPGRLGKDVVIPTERERNGK
ncbi:skin secretory protein xP2-like [Hyalella azteca]|uniref:Skin secretory protein xP2-like n=1 Tax=Hyalella azteca TaxID=294128 RepID=A0A979FGI6_HYAAZ|nr:skin secretory protein xP2-like [Hyalella azteca]